MDRDLDAMGETLSHVRAVGCEITAVACDVTDSAAVARMVDERLVVLLTRRFALRSLGARDAR